MRQNSKQQAGFTLVEIMIVVSIIGILASIAFPKWEMFIARSKQAEAKMNLSQIYSLEQSYFAENDEYAAVPSGSHCVGNNQKSNNIGFYIDCEKSRYLYEVTVTDKTAFVAKAVSKKDMIISGCPAGADKWSLDQDRKLDKNGDITKKASC